ncbi:MAG: cytidine deaminase [Pirellulales bacterium]|nr:cytidine deaminase [Pirellulales bacterium]
MITQYRDALIESALAIRGRAYAPYSKFPVGAALLGTSGTIYCGVNVENTSSGLTVCAERNAIANAIIAGERTFAGLAIALEGGGTPCGACRQVLAEFCPDDLPILLVNANDPSQVEVTSLAALLPKPFRLSRE